MGEWKGSVERWEPWEQKKKTKRKPSAAQPSVLNNVFRRK